MFVPVVGQNQIPLMPTTPARARKWLRSGKATPFWKKGIFCVRLNVKPSNTQTQPIAVGIDPGSKREGYSIKSESHTYLNIQANAIDWVSDAVKTRRVMRQNRRSRNCPYRQPRWANRAKKGIPPSTKARWQWKLRIATWLTKIFPIAVFVVEDIKAATKGQPRWDKLFSPLQIGKQWFYSELAKLARVETRRGYETQELRDGLRLKKSTNKLSDTFEAHCVDSWVLANWYVGGHLKPDNTQFLHLVPLRFHRRQLHRLQPGKGGLRKSYGGTRSLGLKRGTWVKHPKYGLCYIGGTTGNRVSVHAMQTGKRLAENIKTQDCRILTRVSWRIQEDQVALKKEFAA